MGQQYYHGYNYNNNAKLDPEQGFIQWGPLHPPALKKGKRERKKERREKEKREGGRAGGKEGGKETKEVELISINSFGSCCQVCKKYDTGKCHSHFHTK